MSIESGLRIKRLREFRNFTQQYLADKLEISQNAYSKIENGSTKLTIERLEQIAQLLDVPFDTVLSEKSLFNFENNTISKFYALIENLHEEKEGILQQQIEFLQKQNGQLLKTIEELGKKLGK